MKNGTEYADAIEAMQEQSAKLVTMAKAALRKAKNTRGPKISQLQEYCEDLEHKAEEVDELLDEMMCNILGILRNDL